MQKLDQLINAAGNLESESMGKLLASFKDEEASKIKDVFEQSMKDVVDDATEIKKMFGKQKQVPLKGDSSKEIAVQAVTIDFESAKKAHRGLDAVSVTPEISTSMQQNTASPTFQKQRSGRAVFLGHKTPSQRDNKKPNQDQQRKRPVGKPKFDTSNMSRDDYIAMMKANTKCHKCGTKGHWASDQECPASTASPTEETQKDTIFQ